MSTEFRLLPLPPEGKLTPRYAQMFMETKAAEWVRLLEAGYLAVTHDREAQAALLFLANDVGNMLDACNDALGRGLTVDVARDSDAEDQPEELPGLVAAFLSLDPEEIGPCWTALRELAGWLAERDASFQVARGEARRHLARRVAQHLTDAMVATEDVEALALRLELAPAERLVPALRAALETVPAADEPGADEEGE